MAENRLIELEQQQIPELSHSLQDAEAPSPDVTGTKFSDTLSSSTLDYSNAFLRILII